MLSSELETLEVYTMFGAAMLEVYRMFGVENSGNVSVREHTTHQKKLSRRQSRKADHDQQIHVDDIRRN